MTMQPWFPQAKLGIFIHWGIYAVDGVAESWSFYGGEVSHQDYFAQLDGFTADAYDPDAWAALIAASGAKYAVLTAKHHDGVALWDTAASDLSVVTRTPAARDLVAEYVRALRARGLKVGLYFSHSDWSHPDYPSVRHADPARAWLENSYSQASPGHEDPAAWQRFLDHRLTQVRELVTRFRPDLLWFDGEWERAQEQWQMGALRQEILALNPDTVLNGRMQGHGDYATPEQGAPIEAPQGPWELCLTVNDSWGFQHTDHHTKSLEQLVRYFTETIGMGGNLLLNIGPRADGTVTEEQTERLTELGAWIARHRPAVDGTTAGLPAGHHYGPSTLSADRRTLYLVCFGNPGECVSVRGLSSKVQRVSVLATGAALSFRTDRGLGDVPGTLWIQAPAGEDLDLSATVLAVELDGELELYRGRGRS